jgi:hypothetical protein
MGALFDPFLRRAALIMGATAILIAAVFAAAATLYRVLRIELTDYASLGIIAALLVVTGATMLRLARSPAAVAPAEKPAPAANTLVDVARSSVGSDPLGSVATAAAAGFSYQFVPELRQVLAAMANGSDPHRQKKGYDPPH